METHVGRTPGREEVGSIERPAGPGGESYEGRLPSFYVGPFSLRVGSGILLASDWTSGLSFIRSQKNERTCQSVGRGSLWASMTGPLVPLCSHFLLSAPHSLSSSCTGCLAVLQTRRTLTSGPLHAMLSLPGMFFPPFGHDCLSPSMGVYSNATSFGHPL